MAVNYCFLMRPKLCLGFRATFKYHGLNDTGGHVYYFSPEASIIAIATKTFQTFNVTQCAEKPNLDGFDKVTIS